MIFARENQLLKDHLIGVGEKCYRFGSEIGLGYTAKVIGLCHDIGKYSKKWQEYLVKSLRGDNVECVEHSANSAAVFEIIVREMINEKDIGIFEDFLPIFKNIIASHHGGLHDDYINKNDKWHIYSEILTIDERTFNDIRYSIDESVFEEIRNSIGHLIEEIRNIVGNISKHTKKKSFFQYSIVCKILYSILVDADRMDAGFYNSHDDENMLIKACGNIFNYTSKFNKNSTINIIRDKILNQCISKGKSIHPGTICGLSTETGSGKTLSSFSFALNHVIANNMNRVIYVVPFLTIADQTSESIKKAIGSDIYNNAVVEDYSSSDVSKSVYHENWDKPIIMTTMVNFMNMLTRSSASELRKFHNVANSCIIFDEIQQLPQNCISIYNESVNAIGRLFNVTSLVCTATTPTLNDVRFNHPLNLDVSNTNIVSLSQSERNVFNARYDIVDMCRSKMSINDLYKIILDETSCRNNFLAVLNTKREVLSLFDTLRNGSIKNCHMLSTNLTKNDRLRIIEQLKSDVRNGEKTVCVSTNLIEAGVDISFDAGLRLAGGEDNIVQTAGRINRHASSNKGKLYIGVLKDEGNGNESEFKIYGDIVRSKNAFILSRLLPKGVIGSDASLKSFYDRKYFENSGKSKRTAETNEESEYPIDNINTTAYKLLDNSDGKLSCKKRMCSEKSSLVYTFQYDTVSKNFKMIDDTIRVFICNNEDMYKTWDEYCELCQKMDENESVFKRSGKHNMEIYSRMSKVMKIIYDNSVSVSRHKKDEIERNIGKDVNGIYVDFDNDNYSPSTGLNIF